ncbi:unnamed protein product [Symbiodinium microadriaticum]|nr:unnamed protein product [Symbiodinium microadriaticum]
MVRCCRLATVLTYCCPCLPELLSPRDVSIIGLAVLVMSAALLLGIASRQRGEEALLAWSQEPWQKARCSVHQVGIAYSGDCNLPRDEEEAYDYGAWPPVKKSSIEAPRHHYTKCPQAGWTCAAEGKAPEAENASTVSRDTLGPIMPRYNLVVCRNSFLPWAMVRIQTESLQTNVSQQVFCGYQAGLPQWSHTETLATAQKFLDSFPPREGSCTCWVLALHGSGCHAVSLQRPSLWGSRAARQGTAARLSRTRLLVAGFLVALLAGALCLAECCAVMTPDAPTTEDAVSVEEELPPETLSERVRRVQQQWSLFRASLVREYEPLGSAREVVDNRP